MKRFLCVVVAFFIMLCAGCAKKTETKPNNPPQNKIENTQKEEVKDKTKLQLFFADSQAMLKEETREVTAKDIDIPQAIVTELIKGPETNGLVSVIPKGTKLNDIKAENGICTVNLSGEFAANRNGGTATDTLAVYSIVNSLTMLDDIEKVQFLIDGEKLEIFGDFLLDEPFEKNESLITK